LRRGLNDWEVDDWARLLGKVDPFCLREGVDDYQHWMFTHNGVFSVESCREAKWIGEAPPDCIWSDMWKLHLPSKVAFFIWFLCRGRIPTIDFSGGEV